MSTLSIIAIVIMVIYLIDCLILIFFQGASDLNKAYDEAIEELIKKGRENNEKSIHNIKE